MIILSTDNFHYSEDTNCFVAEISELGCNLLSYSKTPGETKIKLINPKTNNNRIFEFSHADTDATDEDIYGWNYKSNDDIKLLIIND